MFEKPAFRKAAETQRCIIPAEGYYEYHHFRNKTYPLYIYPKEQGNPFYFAGLWDEWVNPENGERMKTFSIVTTRANNLMAKIHNKPQYADEPRMPLILPEAMTDEYLKPFSREQVEELCEPYPETIMEAHTVRSISGKNSPGSVPQANEKYEYSDLDFDGKQDQLKLFRQNGCEYHHIANITEGKLI
jgi:putative SOS response-associated peptidase YedK